MEDGLVLRDKAFPCICVASEQARRLFGNPRFHPLGRAPAREELHESGLRESRRAALLVSLILAVLLTGCAHQKFGASATTRPATRIDPAEAKATYWFARPAVATVSCEDFDALWDGAVRGVKSHWFVIDRADYREGLLTTNPLISRQWFEPWRSDVLDGYDLLLSSLSTVRRTVHISIRRLPDGDFELTPKVLVERHAIPERRITSVTEYQDIFAGDRPLQVEETEAGTKVVTDYWYAVGRDTVLETALVKEIRRWLDPRLCQE